MAHKVIESHAIQPHNAEAHRVDSLLPEQLRGNAKNFLDLLTEYYNYMNVDGIVNKLNIIKTGTGTTLRYTDLKVSEAKLGLEISGFVPSTYNQEYKKLTEEEILQSGIPASELYQGLSVPDYYVAKLDKNRIAFKDTWVLISSINGSLTLDFYDKNWELNTPGSNTDDLQNIQWHEQVSGLLTAEDTTSSASYTIGLVDPIGLTPSIVPRKTNIIEFKNLKTIGGNGQDLTVDVLVDTGKVVSITPNEPGFNYRMDDYIEIADEVLTGTLFSISEVISSPTNVVERILEEHDIDKTTEDYITRIQKEIAKSIPDAINLDRNDLYKKIVEYYNTRGSEDSIISFFKIFFDVPARVQYPKDQLFKPSDGIYKGTASVSDTKEKYWYKNGWDKGRRIHFFKKSEYDNTRSGTYFIDFEFGNNFRKNATADSASPNVNATSAFKNTILFSGRKNNKSEFSIYEITDTTFTVRIDSNNDLIIKGRFGEWESDFSKVISNYVSGTNDFPFQEPANEARRRVRLAISVNIERTEANRFGDTFTCNVNQSTADQSTSRVIVTGASDNPYTGEYEQVTVSGVTYWRNVTNGPNDAISATETSNKGYFFFNSTDNRWQFGATKAYATATGTSTNNSHVNPSPNEATGFWSVNENTNWTAGNAVITGHAEDMSFTISDARSEIIVDNTSGTNPQTLIDSDNYDAKVPDGWKVFKADGTSLGEIDPKVVSFNSGTGVLTLDRAVQVSDNMALSIREQKFRIGSVKVLLSNDGQTSPVELISSSNYDGGYTQKDKTHDFSTYPGALGGGRHHGGAGAYLDYEENPEGELYFYKFAFVPYEATNSLMVQYRDNNSLPNNPLIDLNFNNKGSSLFTNVGKSLVVARQIRGFLTYRSSTNLYGPITETNYGLSSTGSEYPRRISWDGVKGFLSNVNKLHDGDYYQEFSYLIKTELSVDNWETEYQKLVHPAGLKFFTAVYLELASRSATTQRADNPNPPEINVGEGVRSWLAAIQNEVPYGQHSPRWQPGWLEYLFNVLIEIILYEQYSAFYKPAQPNWNKISDEFYTHDKGLRIKQLGPASQPTAIDSSGFTLKGNAKQAVLDSVNSLDYNSKYVELSGEGTGITTGAKIDESSVVEIDFKLLKSGKESIGRYVAGSKWRGQDGHIRELSIKQIQDEKDGERRKRVEVTVTDNQAHLTSAEKADILSARVIGGQLDFDHESDGVYFSDSTVAQMASGNGSGNNGQKFATSSRGHTLLVFNPTNASKTISGDSYTPKKYRVFNFDTYSGTGSSHADRATAEAAMITKLQAVDAANDGMIVFGFTEDAAGLSSTTRAALVALGARDTKSTIRDGVATGNRSAHCFVMSNRTNSANSMKRFYEQFQTDLFLGVGSSANTFDQHLPQIDIHYDAQGNLSKGPFLLKQPEKGAKPVIVPIHNTGYTCLKIKGNGEVIDKTSGTDVVYRSELEASSPHIIRKLNYSRFDWSGYINNVGGNTGGVFDTHYPNKNTGTEPYWSAGNTFSNAITDGLITNGGATWVYLNPLIKIDVNAQYKISFKIKNLLPGQNRIYAGVQSTLADGTDVRGDDFDSFNYGVVAGEKLAGGEEKTYEAIFSGFNAIRDELGGDVSNNASSKFDPGATHFRFMFITNYGRTVETTDGVDHPNLLGGGTQYNPANTANSRISSITIERVDGIPLETNSITPIKTYDPIFGIKKITSASLPFVDTTDSPAQDPNTNGTFTNTLAIGTIANNKNLAGVHEVLYSGGSSNILETTGALPWKVGTGSFVTDNSLTWVKNGTTSDNAREYRIGPHGYKEVVWVARDSSTDDSSDGGFHSPITAVDKSHAYRFAVFFKRKTYADGNIYFGFDNFTSANDTRVGARDNGYANPNSKAIIDDIVFGSTTLVKLRGDGKALLQTGTRPFQFDNTGISSNIIAHPRTKVYYPKYLADQSTDEVRVYQIFTDQTLATPLDTSSITETYNRDLATGRIRTMGNHNPYFYSGSHTQDQARGIELDKWYMAIGYVLPAPGEPLAKNGLAGPDKVLRDTHGIYDVETGERIFNSFGIFRWSNFTTRARIRAYQFYNVRGLNDEVEFAQPYIEKLDGTERTIEQLINLDHRYASYFPSNMRLNTLNVTGNKSENDVKYLVTETNVDGKPLSTFNEAQTTDNGSLAANKSFTAAVQKATLKNTIKFGGADAGVLSKSGIKLIEKTSNFSDSRFREAAVDGKRFTILPTHHSSLKGAELEVIMEQGSVGGEDAGAIGFVTVNVIKDGINFDEGDVITIPNSKLDNSGVGDTTITVKEVGHGGITLEQNSLANLTYEDTATSYLTRDIDFSTNENPIGGLTGAYTTDDFTWEKDKEYEISFNATKVNDRNTFNQLYIGGNKIGYYTALDAVEGISNAKGNPNTVFSIANGQSNHGDGPHEFKFQSSTEGPCRIYLNIAGADEGWRLAHNGHQLKVDDTNSESISRNRVPINYNLPGTTDLGTRPEELKNVHRNYLGEATYELSKERQAYALYVFESDHLCIGENIIQLYNYVENDIKGNYLMVEPAKDGLIIEGQNTHNLYFSPTEADSRIIIDHKVDRTSNRPTNSLLTRVNKDFDTIHEYNWKFENIKVRVKRKRIYDGYYQALVSDASAFSGPINPSGQWGTENYRPVVTTGPLACDGAIGSGGTIEVPALQIDSSPNCAGLGQEYVTSTGNAPVPLLGVPKGKFGALKFNAVDSQLHYISLGDDEVRFPKDTFKPVTQYEISGKVFIPNSNKKIRQVHVMAGFNPRKVDDNDQYVTTFDSPNDVVGRPVFKYDTTIHQVQTGRLAGYDVYGGEKTTITQISDSPNWNNNNDNTAPSNVATWQSFTHKFTTPQSSQDENPKIRFVGTPQESLRGFNGYTSSASDTAAGEYFYIKDIVIKEGVNPDVAPEKNYIDERHEGIVNRKDLVSYDLSMNSPAINEEACISADIKFPKEGNNFYEVRYQSNTTLGSFNLNNLQVNEPNKLASFLPFTIGEGSQTKVIDGTTTTTFSHLGNPVNQSLGITPLGSNSPYKTTHENIRAKLPTPFGYSDVLWEARNMDGAFANLREEALSIGSSGSGYPNGTYTDIELSDSPNDTDAVPGTGAKATIVVSSGSITSATVTSGGIAYGRVAVGGNGDQYERGGIALKIKDGQSLTTSGTAAGFTGALANGPMSDSAANKARVLSMSDGGFTSAKVDIDPTKTYRFSVWVKQTNTRFSTGSVPTFETQGGRKIVRWNPHTETDARTPVSNITSEGYTSQQPKFIDDWDVGAHDSPTHDSPNNPAALNQTNANQWFLVVGHAHAYDQDVTVDHPDSGVYIPSKNPIKAKPLKIANNEGDWKLTSSVKKVTLSASVSGNPLSTKDSVFFYAPRIDEINGLEPTLQELTSGAATFSTTNEDLDRKIQIVNWQTPINDAYDVIKDYTHVIDGDDFRVSIDETKNNIEYTDTIDSALNVKGATTDTIIEIEIPAHASSTTYNFILPLQNAVGSTAFGANIDWGDGNADFVRFGSDKDLHHVYPQTTTAKRFQIKINGQFDRINTGQSTPASKSQSSQGGPLNTSDYNAAKVSFKSVVRKVYLGSNQFKQPANGNSISFTGSTGLTHFITTKGITNTSAVTNMQGMFENCVNLIHADLRGLDTSNVTSFNKMFQLETYSNWSSSLSVTTGQFVFHQTNRVFKSLTGVNTSTQPQSDSTNWVESLPHTGEHVKTLKVIGLFDRNISSLSRGQGKGMVNMFRGVKFDSDELSRCYIAWRNSIFGTSPTGTGASSSSTAFKIHMGDTKYDRGNQFDSPGDSTATMVVNSARTALSSGLGWTINDGGVL